MGGVAMSRTALVVLALSVLLPGCSGIKGVYSVDVERTLKGIDGIPKDAATEYNTPDEYRKAMKPWLSSLSLAIARPERKGLFVSVDYTFIVKKYFRQNPFRGAIRISEAAEPEKGKQYLVYQWISGPMYMQAGRLEPTESGAVWLREKGYPAIYFRR